MSIFTLERREELQEKLLEVGIELIKEKGIRKMTISEVTKRSGMGKGTFYHFYEAKEFYVWDVIRYSKNAIKQILNETIEQKGGYDKNAFKEIIKHFSFYSNNNIINYITDEDEQWLREKLPKEYILDIPKEEEIIEMFLKFCINKKENINGHAIANMMKIMALTVEHKKILHEDALQVNIDLMIEAMCNYIFDEDYR